MKGKSEVKDQNETRSRENNENSTKGTNRQRETSSTDEKTSIVHVVN